MKINFNNVRKQAGHAYNRFIKSLRNENFDDRKIIDMLDDLQKEHLQDLRQMICAIQCTYQPDDDDFKDVGMDLEDIYDEGE